MPVKTISKFSRIAFVMHLSISSTFLNGAVVGTDTIKSISFLLFKNLIACRQTSISGEFFPDNFFGLINGTSALFFFASHAAPRSKS